MSNDHVEKHVMNQISESNIPFDIKEQETSNTLISGANKSGKSRLACGIASILQTLNWRIVAFDPVGNYRKISDIPIFYTVRKQRNYDPENKEWYYPLPTNSMIFDTSLMIPDLQKSFVNDVLERLWNAQLGNPSKHTLILLEESQLFMRNIRGSVAQNLLRICSAGRNLRIRVLAVTVDLALIDASFIRLTAQRYYARLNIEENSKRKFRNYHGLDWTRIATELDLGFFIHMLRDKMKIVHAPLFEPKILPVQYTPTMIEQTKPKSLWQRIKEFFFGTSAYRKTGGQNEAMRVSL